MRVESAAQVSDRTFLFIMIWSWINTYHGIPEHQGHQGLPPLLEEKYSSGQGLDARVCKQIVFLKGKRRVRVEGRTIFLCNTDWLILQNFTGTVMSVARRKNQNTPTSGITTPTKPPREKKVFSKAVIWSVQFLSFNQMVLKQPKGSIWQHFVVLLSKELPYLHLLVCTGAGCISPRCPLCAGQALHADHLSWAVLSLLWLLTQHPDKPQVPVSEASERRSYLEIHSLLICCLWNAEPLGPIRTAGNIHPVPD